MGKIERVFVVAAAFGIGVALTPLIGSNQTAHQSARDSVSAPLMPSDTILTDFEDYAWPIETGKAITSSFGEFRRTHFHGGIDISTNNRNGYRVFASRGGYVSRIRVNPTGYGKMLYVRHADGYITTYAHLEKFNAEIDARVRSEQLKLERYPVDIECQPSEFPVNKGDIIAYSGETGTGTPHLHFEIRDENLEPINPFLCPGLQVEDNIPPTLRRIAVRPLGPKSVVNGGTKPQTYAVEAGKGEMHKIAVPIRLTGQIGFALDAIDRSNGSRFRQGIYSNDLFVDDRLIYSTKLDRVPAVMAHQIALFYDWDLLRATHTRYQKLYAESPNDLPFYRPKGAPSGIVNTADFADGPHEFRIVSADFNGKRSVVTGTVILNHAPDFDVAFDDDHFKLKFADLGNVKKVMVYTKRNGSEQWNSKTISNPSVTDDEIIVPRPKGAYDIVKLVAENTWGSHSSPHIIVLNKPNRPGGSLQLHHEMKQDYVLLSVQSDRIITTPPSVIAYEGSTRQVVPLTALDEKSYSGVFHPSESYRGVRRLVAEAEEDGHSMTAHNEFEVHPIVPSTSGSMTFDDGNLVISYDSSSVFTTTLLQVEKSAYDGDVSYSLLPENTVLRKGLNVAMKATMTQEKQGLFFRGQGGWELIATERNSEGMFQGTITRWLGEVSIMTDEIPPSISRLRISETSSRRPAVSFRLSDNLSGVEYNELKLYIDGAFVIPEIDGEHRRVSYRASDPLEKGPHQLTIRMRDRMGNTREEVHHFTTP